MQQCYMKEGKAETPLTHVPAKLDAHADKALATAPGARVTCEAFRRICYYSAKMLT
jgi:hypothetical protein